MAESVDALDLGSSGATRESSSLSFRTNQPGYCLALPCHVGVQTALLVQYSPIRGLRGKLMQVSVESGEGLHRRIHVELPGTEVEHEIEIKLKELTRTVRLHGFRPGKVPAQLIRQRFFGNVVGEVLNEKVKASWSEAVKQSGLNLVGTPEIEPHIDSEAARYGYTAAVEVLPEITLVDFSDVVIERPVATVTDADFANMIKTLQHQLSSWQVVARPAARGDQVRVNLAVTIEGEPQDSHPSREFRILLGAGVLIEDLEAALVGVAAGESLVLDLRIPENHPMVPARGKPVRYEAQVMEVFERVLPAVDAAFARRVGIEDGDMARLEQDVRMNMDRELNLRIKGKVKMQVINALLDRHSFDVPKALVREEIDNLRKRHQEGDPHSDKIPSLDDSFLEEAAQRRVRVGLLFTKIASEQAIKVSPSKVRAYIEDLAVSYEDPKELIQNYYKTPELLHSAEWAVMEDHVVEWVLSRMRVQDIPMSFDRASEVQSSINP
ncbi:Trigger factor [Gammaproteobacteria bacterium]